MALTACAGHLDGWTHRVIPVEAHTELIGGTPSIDLTVDGLHVHIAEADWTTLVAQLHLEGVTS